MLLSTGEYEKYVKLFRGTNSCIRKLSLKFTIFSFSQSNTSLMVQIALTALCPDILMYSQSLRRVVIIELACPCEENMERWHSVKSNQICTTGAYHQKNCWGADLFPGEVGA